MTQPPDLAQIAASVHMQRKKECDDAANQFYETLIRDMKDPDSTLYARMTSNASQGLSCVALPAPWVLSTRRKQWDCAVNRRAALNSRLFQDIPLPHDWHFRITTIDDYVLRGFYLCWSSK